MLVPKKYQPIVVISIFVIFSLVILSFSIKGPLEAGFFRKLVLEAALPLEKAVTATMKVLGDSWKRYIFLIGLEEENRRLKKDNAILTDKLNRLKEGNLEAQRLQKLFALKDNLEHSVIAARVIDKSLSALYKTILINRGSSHGIKAGMPVINDQGVVGRVVEVSWHTSRILLIIDEKSNIDAAIQDNRAQGILQGDGSSGCHIKYVSTLEDVKAGDTVVSSGLAGVFPKGLILGTVQYVDRKEGGLFQKIMVNPAVDIGKMEEVLVLERAKAK